jgi:hypothetical protein
MSDTPPSPKRKSADSPARASGPRRAAPAPAPPAPAPVPERLARSLAAGRTSPEALVALFDALDAAPHVATTASNAREAHVRHLILLDKLLDAARQARAKAADAWERTPWALRHGDNLAFLDGIDEPDGSLVPDGCAVCGAPRPEYIDPAAHFGARGESPPDAKCSQCRMNFHNHYDSEHALQLHVAARHAAEQHAAQ